MKEPMCIGNIIKKTNTRNCPCLEDSVTSTNFLGEVIQEFLEILVG
jgi:hypothetical protein